MKPSRQDNNNDRNMDADLKFIFPFRLLSNTLLASFEQKCLPRA